MDSKFMKLAIDLAKKGEGNVSPNPLVGAIIVKDELVIGQGYHEKYGGDHAEVNAFRNAKKDTEGATMYVTLEPCSHYGKTPPCADKIIENKIKKVVIGMKDPNELVSGKGIEKLKNAGIEVVVGVLEEECQKLNEIFIKYITTKRPFVILKTAMSLDGKIATKTGESKWITSEESRKTVHGLRNKLSGIMVGINTVIQDDPQLTCRIEYSRNPIRIIVDSSLRIPMCAKVININDGKTIVACTKKANSEKIKKLEQMGIKILIINEKNGQVDLNELMSQLGALNLDSILLEGGSTLNYSALAEKIVDKIMIYIAPKIIGGDKSKTAIGGSGIHSIIEAFKVNDMKVKNIGEDILLEGYLE